MQGGTSGKPLSPLLGAHGLLVAGRLLQKPTLQHPIDLRLELGGLVGLDAGQFGEKAVFAQLRLQVAQEFGPRAILVLAQPFDRAIERAPQLPRGFFVNILPRDDAAAPTQIGNFAAASAT